MAVGSLRYFGSFDTRYWFTGSSDSWGKKSPLAVCEKEVIMILYKPKERTEPYKTNEQIKELYLKYRDILESPIQKKRGFIWKIKKLFGVINQN